MQCFFNVFVVLEARKVSSLKRWMRRYSAEKRFQEKNCTSLWREAHSNAQSGKKTKSAEALFLS